MKLLACLAVLLPCALAGPTLDLTLARHLQTDVDLNRPLEHTFAAFKNVHKKHYEDDREEAMRKGIFKVNIDTIIEHNKQYAKREKSYYLGVNQFTDLTHLEFLRLYTGHILAARKPSNATTYLSPANVLLPDQVDWRTKGYVTPVKNQEQCGSCWSFSTTGSLEGQHFKKTGKLLSLSEQQLVDCSGPEGNQGCNGGLMDQAFQYIIDAGGIESEKAYPYDGKDEKCQFDEKLEVATVTGYTDVTAGSEDELQNAVGTQGPVSIAIDASHKSFQLYAGGVYVEPECSSTELDHGVLIVGYGTESMDDYWLVKNSWGTTWGEEGYIKMARNKENQCGVASQASYPLV